MESNQSSPSKRKSNTGQRQSITIRQNFNVKKSRTSMIREDSADDFSESGSNSPSKKGHKRNNTAMSGSAQEPRGQTEIIRSSAAALGGAGATPTKTATISSTIRQSIRSDTMKFRQSNALQSIKAFQGGNKSDAAKRASISLGLDDNTQFDDAALRIEFERLRTTIVILNEKMKVAEDNADLTEKWKGQVQQKDSQIKMLNDQKDRTYEESEKQRAKCKDLASQLAEMESELLQVQSKAKHLHSTNGNLEEDIGSQKNDYNKLQKQFNILYSENENNIKENDNLRAVRQENEAEIQDLNSEIEGILNDNELKIQQLQGDHNLNISNLQNENSKQVSELQKQHGLKIQEIQNENAKKIQQFQQIQNDLQIQIDQIQNAKNQCDVQIKGLNTDVEQLETELANLKRKYKQQGQERDELESALKNEKNLTQSLKTQISEMELSLSNHAKHEREIAELRAKMQEQIDSLQEELANSEESREDLKADLEENNEKLIQLEQELFEHKSIELELLRTIKELEEKLDSLGQEKADRLLYLEEKVEELLNIIEQMEHGQAIYIAHRNDKIDKQLANFVNKYPERKKMNIAFVRESEGVYQFGQKRVYIKVEKGDKILVRVGGGFMSIEEFIWQYSPEETEKIQRHDVMAKFSNKIALQKISDTQSINRREASPIRSPQRPRSPETRGRY